MANKKYSRAAKRRLNVSDEAKKAIAVTVKQPVLDNRTKLQRGKNQLPSNMGRESVK